MAFTVHILRPFVPALLAFVMSASDSANVVAQPARDDEIVLPETPEREPLGKGLIGRVIKVDRYVCSPQSKCQPSSVAGGCIPKPGVDQVECVLVEARQKPRRRNK